MGANKQHVIKQSQVIEDSLGQVLHVKRIKRSKFHVLCILDNLSIRAYSWYSCGPKHDYKLQPSGADKLIFVA